MVLKVVSMGIAYRITLNMKYIKNSNLKMQNYQKKKGEKQLSLMEDLCRELEPS